MRLQHSKIVKSQVNMIKFRIVIFCTLLVSFSSALDNTADYCQLNFSISDFPQGLLDETVSLLTMGIIEKFFGCFGDQSVPASDVKFWYYSRNNPDVPILLDQNNPSQIDPTKKTILLAPGWLCNVTNDGMPALRESYLKRYDANIIGIDWTARSIALYSEAFCSAPGVSEIIGSFLCNINATMNVALSEVHMLGHSMGGQISGLTGQEVQKQCSQTLGRITGLDPAGPLYHLLSENRRLSKDDATFVDVIHSNMGFLGYWGACGDVDFYPNCGTYQPGCFRSDKITSVSDIINLPLAYVACNHFRAAFYMNESISSDNFKAKSCALCPGVPIVGWCISDIILGSTAIMGENCPSSNPTSKRYNLQTNSQPPYAEG